MTAPSRLSATCYVAKNEFARVYYHPLTPVIILLLTFLAILNGAGGTAATIGGGHTEKGLYYCLGQTFMFTAVYCSVVAVFVGVISIAEERRNHSLNVLLSKPLYRQDLIVGKLLGLNVYMLFVIVYSLLLAAVALSLLYKMPADPADFLSRIAIYALIAMVYASLSLTIAMFIGAVIKDLLISTSLAVAYIFIDGYVGWTWLLPWLSNFSPKSAMCSLYISKAASLQSVSLTMGEWFDANLVNLFFFVAAIVLACLATMAIYTKGDIV
ncbi:ABC transporter permease [Methanocella arvoryzae]|uniref:ABC-type transport system, permease component n=1 Tax=Methanocella arvoryzae (strain DSM 22066 / NBRC 105507 / MRE50) TaxID=351160 RepID=Q0W8Y3_METAR|nr:ABC transporter permease subunit [Methanocella arvoryzae]CAJ35143.1 conserved hypothetical protein [Methanocella arvoryzae MRE50]